MMDWNLEMNEFNNRNINTWIHGNRINYEFYEPQRKIEGNLLSSLKIYQTPIFQIRRK